MVARGCHVRLSTCDWGQLIKEVFENGGVGILAVEDVFWCQVPIVSVCKVSRVQHKIVVVNSAGECSNSSVVQCRLNIGNVALARSSVPICTIDPELTIENVSARLMRLQI